MKIAHTIRFGLTVLALTIAANPTVSASDAVRVEVRKLATQLLAVLDDEGQTALAVGQFQGPPQLEANAGPGIEKLLIEELESLRKGVVRKRAAYSVQGRYAPADDPNDRGLLIMELVAEVFNERNARVREIVAAIRDTRDVVGALGVTVGLPADGTKAVRHEVLRKALQSPTVHVGGAARSEVSSNPDSPYAVEILARRNGSSDPAEARPARLDEGLALVDLRPGELYEVRLHNRSKDEVAVTLSVDGLDVFTFSDDRNDEGQPRFTHFILAANASLTLVGWHKTVDPERKDNFLSFLVTEYGQGAVSQFSPQARGKVGVIAVSFAHCFPPGARAGGETGFGPPREVKQEVIRRKIDPPHDFVSIRYNR